MGKKTKRSGSKQRRLRQKPQTRDDAPRLGDIIEVEGRYFQVVNTADAMPKYRACRDCPFWHPEAISDEGREEWGTDGCLYVTEGFIVSEEECEDVQGELEGHEGRL